MTTNNRQNKSLTVKALAVMLVFGAMTPAASAQAQERSSSSLFLQLSDKADITVPFIIGDEGKRFQPTWGLDQAWISDSNIRKGLNHMGKENIGIGRTAFRTNKALVNDTTIAANPLSKLKERNSNFDIIDKKLPLVLTADQEAGSDEYFVKNKSADIEHWAANINSHVHWLQKNSTHPVIGVSPFNEPDYWAVEEGATPAKQRDVAKLLKEKYPRMAEVAIVGGNTLNDDKAWEWFEPGKQYYDWGNTHQLAGSFDNFASFFTKLANEGKVGYADEMHNVAEAMVGLEYGMTVGIWWGFDSRARGEFCDISRNGRRIAYAEHRNNWTAASVYQHDDGRVKAFVGSSERQAYTTTYQFISPHRDVYFDGHGPMRTYTTTLPGGTGYQNGQTNAERVIDITWGDDVAPRPITDGIYKIVNKRTGNVVAINNSLVVQQQYTGQKTQQWHILPCTTRSLGDLSFYDIESVTNEKIRINVKDFSKIANADLLAWSQDSPSSNEQWYLEYAGNGYYLIRNRESALYMASKSTSKNNNVQVTQLAKLTETTRDRALWRLLPVDIDYETEAPAKPLNLLARPKTAAVTLTWDANTEDDLAGYMVLRAPAGTEEWNTIARNLTGNSYTDNTCRQGTAYIYKVKAIDRADNYSEPSEPVEAAPYGTAGLVAMYPMDDSSFNDCTDNMMDAVGGGKYLFIDDSDRGCQVVRMLGAQKSYMQLPYEVASSDELTFAAWVKVTGSANWQRIFDFGYDTDHYLFLTPTNGSVMRFAIKNGGSEQQLDAPKLQTMVWKHVAVTIGKGRTAIYIDGEEVAATTTIDIKPSDVAPSLNYIGRSQFSADPFLTAYIDDVQIYNFALNAEQVKQSMSGSIPAVTGIEHLGEKTDGDNSNDIRGRRYDLGGKRVGTAAAKGLYIRNGGKELVKTKGKR